MRLEHVNLTVSDLDRSVAFYCDLLGLHVRWKGLIDDERRAAHVGDDLSYLALFEATSSGARDRVGDAVPGMNHFGWVVEDLDETRRRLEGLGASVRLEAEYDPGRRFYFLDPDGNDVEIIEYR